MPSQRSPSTCLTRPEADLRRLQPPPVTGRNPPAGNDEAGGSVGDDRFGLARRDQLARYEQRLHQAMADGDHQKDQDHHVPHRRRDRGDGEVVVGLQDTHQEAVQPQDQHHREEDL